MAHKWDLFVKKGRAKWQTHTQYSQICSLHFCEADLKNFDKWKMGFAERLFLKIGAVPTSTSPTVTAKQDFLRKGFQCPG